jgi:uncharacterized membrane protein required for colicin V production
VEIGEFITSIAGIDLLLLLGFGGFFILGFAQGTIRRLIGLASVLFSFFFAANIAEPLGNFLSRNWTQFYPEYSYMVGFLTVFVAASLAFALVAQGFYKPQPLFAKARFVDEVLGGTIGVIQFGVILGALVVILDGFFATPGIEPRNDLPLLREVWEALDGSAIVSVFRSTFIPLFFDIFGFLIPDSIEARYPSGQ